MCRINGILVKPNSMQDMKNRLVIKKERIVEAQATITALNANRNEVVAIDLDDKNLEYIEQLLSSGTEDEDEDDEGDESENLLSFADTSDANTRHHNVDSNNSVSRAITPSTHHGGNSICIPVPEAVELPPIQLPTAIKQKNKDQSNQLEGDGDSCASLFSNMRVGVVNMVSSVSPRYNGSTGNQHQSVNLRPNSPSDELAGVSFLSCFFSIANIYE